MIASHGAVRAQEAAIDLQVGPVLAREAPTVGWAPITLTLRNRGGDFRGTAVIRATTGENGFHTGSAACIPTPQGCIGGNQDAAISYRIPVALGAGATKRVPFDIGPDLSSVHVELVSDDGTVVGDADATPASSDSASVVPVAVVSDEDGVLDSLSALRLPLGARRTTEGTGGSGFATATTCGGYPSICSVTSGSLPAAAGAEVRAVHLHPAELPSSGVALGSLAAILIDGADTAVLSSDQRSALADYIRGGGALVVAGGPRARAVLSGLPAAMVPVTVAGASTATLSGLGAVLEAPPLTGPVDLATVRVVDGSVLYADGATPLAVDGVRGQGQVVFLAFDPASEPMRSWVGTTTLLRRVLSLVHAQSATVAGPQAQFAGITRRGVELQQAATSLGAVSLPSGSALGALIALYVLVVGPVNFVVLRRSRRLDAAWLTVPAISLVAAGAAYSVGLGSDRHDAIVNTVRVTTVEPGGGAAYVESFNAVYLPHGGPHSLHQAGRPLVTALRGISGAGAAGVTVDGGHEGTIVVDGPAATVEGYATAEFGTTPAGIAAELTERSGHLVGTVTNHLDTELTDARLVIPQGATVPLGAIARGASAPIDAAPPDPAPSPSFMPSQTYSPFSQCVGIGCPAVGGDGREQAIRQMVMDRLSNDLAGGSAGGRPLLVALAAGSLSPGDVSGSNVQTATIDAVVVPLGSGRQAVSQSISGDVIEAPTASRGGAVTLAAGRPAVVEMVLPRPDWHPASLAVTAQIQPTEPGPATSPTGAQPLGITAEVYNVGTGAWDPIGGITSQGTVTLPMTAAGHVGGDGAVLVRLVSMGGGEIVTSVSIRADPADG